MAKQKTGKAAKREMRELIQLEGLPIAYRTAIGICLDKNAQATAKATAVGVLFRASGMLDKPGDGEDGEKELHEKSRDELLADFADAMDELRAINGEVTTPPTHETGVEEENIFNPDGELFD